MNQVIASNLYKAARAVKQPGKKHAYPVLNCAHVSADGYGIRLETTNLDKPLKATAAARISEPFETCVPFKPFRDWLHVTGNDVLTLEFNPGIQILTLRTANSKAEFKCIDALEFPAI